MSTSGKTPSNPAPSKKLHQRQGSFFRRLDVRLPWLKLVAVLVIGAIAIFDLLDFTISKINDPEDHVKTAPMSRHVKITERTLEGKKLVALTFDDGPSPETTPKLLDLLTEKDAPATFFMLGSMARTNPDIVKRIRKEHHEVASHTMYHQNLIRIPDDATRADINEAKAVFNDIINHGPSYTRPPYGNINTTITDAVGTPIILWSVDTEDWRSKNTDAIINTTMSEVYDGAIILMHDIYPTSVEAVPALIDTLRQNGYELATISELATAKNLTLIPGVIYYDLLP
ncbi:polysaccharide deacetylase family protein [Candidatus Saccharibacteria bacterium]|nr:polysaccharide deacetylase family protein [Candidatus Saccharibacteria bacterium]